MNHCELGTPAVHSVQKTADPSYRGTLFPELSGHPAYVMRTEITCARNIGACMQPVSSFA
jgi:O-acetylhomoserine/O-acetylserine sulfhydrylase-like pyridoxal-dependent enzyme